MPTHRVGVGVFVIQDGGILVGKRGQECARGKGCWALPGGWVEKGESIEAACLRELREETGIVLLPKTASTVAASPHSANVVGVSDYNNWLVMWCVLNPKDYNLLIGQLPDQSCVIPSPTYLPSPRIMGTNQVLSMGVYFPQRAWEATRGSRSWK